MPLVSVIVPVRDGERHLRQALESIVAQTLTDLEVIVVDDGSRDATPAIIAEFAARDPRVRGLPGPATGSAGDARNAGLAVATGDYLAFWDADDQFGPTLLADLHARALADRADIVLTKFKVADERTGQAAPVDWGIRLEYFPEHNPVEPDEVGDALLIAVNPAPWNKLFRGDFVRQAGLRFQSLRRANDVYFTAMALARAERLSYLDGYAIEYRIGNEASLQATRDEAPLEFVEALAELRRGFKAIGGWPRLERALANLAVELSLTALRKATSLEAFTAVHQAVRDSVFPRFGVTGRPADFFLRRDYVRQVHALTSRTTAELLFERLTVATRQAERARAETRAVLRGLGAPPPAAPWASAPGDPRLRGDDREGEREAGDLGSRSGPDLTVIVPAFETERYLTECLASLRERPGVEVQVICVDDGSTDGTRSLLAELATQDPRLLVLHQEHAGQSVARNLALDHATGRYVCFLDSDDYWKPDATGAETPARCDEGTEVGSSATPCEESGEGSGGISLAGLIRHADDNDLDLLMFDAETLREPGVRDDLWQRLHGYYQRPGSYRTPLAGVDLLAALKSGGHYRASACLYLVRRELLTGYGLRFQPGIAHEDNLFTFAVLLAAGRAAHLPVPLYARRLRPGSTMSASFRVTRARGYFVCAVEMLRLVRGRQFEPEVADQVAAVIHRVVQYARAAAVRLDPELIADLGALYPHDPDAKVLTALLAEARAANQLAATPGPGGPTALPPRQGLPRQADRVVRGLKDVLRCATRSRRHG